MEKCEFNFATEELETFVVDDVSRQYVPMVRRDLWSDDPQTRNRRLAVYATLWQTLKTLTLLFNPVTPFLCEFVHQNVFRKLDNTRPESVNFEDWPTQNEKMQDAEVEQAFDMLLRVVALTYSARQAAQLKRRWPLQKAVLVVPKGKLKMMKNLEELFLELANVKSAEYREVTSLVDSQTRKKWAQVSDGDFQVLLYTERDDKLLGEGVMRDLARRVQALRKELGYSPTDVLNAVHLAELDGETTRLLEPYLTEMANLVRAKKVQVHKERAEVEAEWHEYTFDDKKVYVTIT
jgi:valyl-tRNA synthetase